MREGATHPPASLRPPLPSAGCTLVPGLPGPSPSYADRRRPVLMWAGVDERRRDFRLAARVTALIHTRPYPIQHHPSRIAPRTPDIIPFLPIPEYLSQPGK